MPSFDALLDAAARERVTVIRSRLNGNREWAPTGAETRIQAVRRLSKTAASALIDDLLTHTN